MGHCTLCNVQCTLYTLKYSISMGGWVGGAKFVVFNPHASSIAVAVKHCKVLKQCIRHSHELKEKKHFPSHKIALSVSKILKKKNIPS